MTQSTRRILVVEDDPVLARILRDNLVIDGFQVECVSDGSNALSATQASNVGAAWLFNTPVTPATSV